MPKYTWIIASALTVAVLVGFLGLSSYTSKKELDQVKADLAKTQAAFTQSQTAAGALSDKLTESQARIADLQKEKDTALQSRQSLESEMRSALESKDVTISQLQGKLTVNILDRVLFDSGEAELKPEGSNVLRKVAAVLSQHPNLKVHVIGHTDNVPIHRRFASNWELSTARATSAVRFLTETAGVDPRRLGAVGYGEFRPVADNSTAEGRAQNRRIAITILSEELAGSDASPLASTNAPAGLVMPAVATNAPAPQVVPVAATNAPVETNSTPGPIEPAPQAPK